MGVQSCQQKKYIQFFSGGQNHFHSHSCVCEWHPTLFGQPQKHVSGWIHLHSPHSVCPSALSAPVPCRSHLLPALPGGPGHHQGHAAAEVQGLPGEHELAERPDHRAEAAHEDRCVWPPASTAPPPTMLLSSKCPAVPRLWAPRDVAGPAPSATTRSSASWRWRCLPPTEVCPSPLWSDAPQLAVAGLCPPPSPRRLRETRAGGAAVGLCAAEVLRVPVQQSSPQVAIFFASRTLPLFFLSAFCAQGQNCSRKEKQSSTTSHFLLFERLESKEEIVR